MVGAPPMVGSDSVVCPSPPNVIVVVSWSSDVVFASAAGCMFDVVCTSGVDSSFAIGNALLEHMKTLVNTD